jgi:predicted metal-dependent HD superfamily phosphohydrolase
MSILVESRLRCGFSDALYDLLLVRLSEPGRAYHNERHVADLLTKFAAVRHLAENPLAVEKAIWYHDIVYVPGRDDNEDRSIEAALWSLPHDPDIEPVIALINVTRWHEATTPDGFLMCDLDLSILGDSPAVFDRFEAEIRQEFQTVPEPEYRLKRSAVLRGFLKRPRIFRTDGFADREGPARENIRRSLDRLAAG